MKRNFIFYQTIVILFTLASSSSEIPDEPINDLDQFQILVKQMKREFKKLNETNELAHIEDFLSKAENFIKTEKNSQDENEIMEKMEIFIKDIYIYKKQLEEFSFKMKIKQQNEISSAAINLMLSKNYKKASRTFLLISENKIHWVLNETYRGNKKNFYFIKNTVDEIPSISISLEILKYLNILIYNETDINLKLDLIKTIKENVYDQISTIPEILSESMILMDDIKSNLRPFIVKELTNFLTTNNKENFTKIIIHDIKDYKYYRQISDEVFKNLTNYDLIMMVNKIEDDTAKVIILNSLFEKIQNKGLKMETVSDIITIFKIINETYILTDEQFKNFYVLPEIKYNIARQFKKAFLYEFYNENEFDNFINNVCTTDSELFQNIFEIAIEQIYGKTITVEMLKMISKSGSLCANILGYVAVYNRMLNGGDLNMNYSHEIYMFNFFLRKTMNKNVTDVGYKLYEELLTVHSGLSNLPLMKPWEITFKEYKRQNNFEGDAIDVIEYFETNIVRKYDIDFIMRFVASLHDQPIKMYYALMDLQKYSKEIGENSIYLFHITEKYKYFLFNGIYPKLAIDWRSDVNRRLNEIPETIKNIVFCEEVYLKNVRNGGEYLININERVFTSTKGNRTLYSKWKFEFTEYRSEYRIKNINGNYLVWTEKNVILSQNATDDSIWKIIPSGNKILIKSKNNEYLYAGEKNDTKTRNVLTNKKTGEPFGAVWLVESVFSSRRGRWCTDFPPYY